MAQKEMTLYEYAEQENPVRHPTVRLRDGEFTMHPGPCGLFSVHIHHLNIDYVKKPDSKWLYTMDGDGNPKALSVFVLPEDIDTSLFEIKTARGQWL